ncbi:hypothetical protein [Nocardia wallacei]|uniref:hypothetical protein n=1 Tax=Nocardia wallacei TaxID=480035 RepID=UPI0024568764|nr:hypothetical protein [Nocardia wallacei]
MVRAAVESNTITEFLNYEYGYPGWFDNPGTPVDADVLRPHPEAAGVGTAYLHIIPYRTPAEDGMVVCKDMSETAKKVDGKYPLPNPGDRKATLEAIAVQVSDTPLEGEASSRVVKVPHGPQLPGPNGRAARPKRDVFNRSVFVHYQYNSDNYRDSCLPWFRSQRGGDRPSAMRERSENEPPLIEPFNPGWEE